MLGGTSTVHVVFCVIIAQNILFLWPLAQVLPLGARVWGEFAL